MSILEGLVKNPKGIPIWTASGDSTVGFVRAEGGADEYEIITLNKMPRKRVVVSLKVLEEYWLAAPRIDIKWFNKGSAWVRLQDIHSMTPYNRYILEERRQDQVLLSLRVKGTPKVATQQERVYDLMHRYVRVWGVGEEFPDEPIPYQAKKKPVRVKKSPRTALDRILADDLLPEDL